MTPLLMAGLCAALLAITYNHTHANFHHIREHLNGPVAAPLYPGPNGQAPVTLSRTPTSMGIRPEFTALTMFPGRGMQLEQIRALLPGMGDTALLLDVPGGDLSKALTGRDADLNGSLSGTFGGMFLAPWLGRLSGTPLAEQPGTLRGDAGGKPVDVPVSASETTRSIEGLLGVTAAQATQSSVLVDGQTVTSTFRVGAHDAWPSTIEMSGTLRLTGQTVEITWVAKNTGESSAPFAFGWRPFFVLPAKERGQALLFVPSAQGTGKNGGSPKNFAQAGGVPLTQAGMDVSYSSLERGIISDGPYAELRFSDSNVGLRLQMVGDAFHTLRVQTGPHMEWVALEPQTTGPEHGPLELAPGQSVTLRLRLELFQSAAHSSAVDGL